MRALSPHAACRRSAEVAVLTRLRRRCAETRRAAPRRHRLHVAPSAVASPPPPSPRPVFNPLNLHERNELFVGRCAAIGLCACLVGERITGKGPLAQLTLETRLPSGELEPLLLIMVCLMATTTVVPFANSFVDSSAPSVPALGLSYTVERQRLIGRLSMAAFASALVAEAATGSGPLDLLNLDTGVPLNELEAGFVFLLLLLGTGDAGERGKEATAPALSVAAGASLPQGEADDAEPEFDWNADDGDEEED